MNRELINNIPEILTSVLRTWVLWRRTAIWTWFGYFQWNWKKNQQQSQLNAQCKRFQSLYMRKCWITRSTLSSCSVNNYSVKYLQILQMRKTKKCIFIYVIKVVCCEKSRRYNIGSIQVSGRTHTEGHWRVLIFIYLYIAVLKISIALIWKYVLTHTQKVSTVLTSVTTTLGHLVKSQIILRLCNSKIWFWVDYCEILWYSINQISFKTFAANLANLGQYSGKLGQQCHFNGGV